MLQGVVGTPAVHFLAADPTDDQRLGFVLSMGGVGVYDCRMQKVTHFHDPSARQNDLHKGEDFLACWILVKQLTVVLCRRGFRAACHCLGLQGT